MDSSGGAGVKNSPANVWDAELIPALERFHMHRRQPKPMTATTETLELSKTREASTPQPEVVPVCSNEDQVKPK